MVARLWFLAHTLHFLDIVAIALKEDFGVDCVRFDGVLNKDQRQPARYMFDRAHRFKVIPITSGSGGVGLNMQSASICLNRETDRNKVE